MLTIFQIQFNHSSDSFSFLLEQKRNKKLFAAFIFIFNCAHESASLSSRTTRSLRAFVRPSHRCATRSLTIFNVFNYSNLINFSIKVHVISQFDRSQKRKAAFSTFQPIQFWLAWIGNSYHHDQNA